MLALILASLAVPALAQFSSSECAAPCLRFSEVYVNCTPKTGDERVWAECIAPLCMGEVYTDAQKCIQCVGQASAQDVWAGVERACEMGGFSVVNATSSATGTGASAGTGAAAPSGSAGAKSAAGAVGAPFVPVLAVAAAALIF